MNFLDEVRDDSPAWLRDGLDAGENAAYSDDLNSAYSDDDAGEFAETGSPFGDGFDRRLAQQFTGEGTEGFDEGDPSSDPRPISMRSLQWIRRNMTSLRIIVSLQRVTPPDLLDDRPRKISGS